MKQKYKYEIGIDEAGRGCLAGPVVACSFLLPPGFKPHKYLNDSKQMTAVNREIVFEYLKNNYFPYCGVGIISHTRIDEVNILQATFDAMHVALDSNLAFQQSNDDIKIIVDGDKFRKYPMYEHECVPKADSKFYSVAAASVLAKVTRDRIMIDLHQNEKYAGYNFLKHKGYATPEHYAMIELHGISDIHRKTFRLLPMKSVKLF